MCKNRPPFILYLLQSHCNRSNKHARRVYNWILEIFTLSMQYSNKQYCQGKLLRIASATGDTKGVTVGEASSKSPWLYPSPRLSLFYQTKHIKTPLKSRQLRFCLIFENAHLSPTQKWNGSRLSSNSHKRLICRCPRGNIGERDMKQ